METKPKEEKKKEAPREMKTVKMSSGDRRLDDELGHFTLTIKEDEHGGIQVESIGKNLRAYTVLNTLQDVINTIKSNL